MPIFNVFVYSFIAGLSTLFGVWLVRRYNTWTKNNIIYLLSFAVGVLFANAFLHLLPESITLQTNWPYWTFAGILILFLIEHFITIHACAEPEECETHHFGIVSVIGIGLHSLIDGIIIAVGFEVSPLLGFLSAAAVIAHEIPEGVFTYSLLQHSNVPEKQNIQLSWIVALATPFGAVITILLLKNLPESVLGIMLALAAGSFIYIGASDLTPELHKKSNILNIILLFLGIFFVITVSNMIK